MIDIGQFLRDGETTVYTTRPSLMRRATAALVITLAVGALTAPAGHASTDQLTTTQGGFELAMASPSEAKGMIRVPNNGATGGYEADAHTLLYQGLIDPTLTKIRAVSVESAYLNQFIKNLPAGVAHLKPGAGFNDTPIGQYPAESFQTSFIYQAPSGMALSFHDSNDGTSYCFVRSIGISTSFEQTQPGEEIVTRHKRLYAVSPSHQEAYTLVHELAHCAKIETELSAGVDALSNVFRVAFSEARSDLAVVLYTASRTGSFASGMAAVGALRGNVSLSADHSTVGMLDVLLAKLDPKDYEGKQVHELIEDAVSITNSLTPAQVSELKLAFAKDAFAQRTLIGQGPQGERVREATSAYTRFAGSDFTINLDDYGHRNVQYSLDNAMLNSDAIRASNALTIEDVQDYASGYGISLNSDQLAVASFLSNETDSLVAGASTPLDLKALEQEAVMALTSKERSSARFNTHLSALNGALEQPTAKQRLAQFDARAQKALDNTARDQTEAPAAKPAAPRIGL